jgi:molybdopterin-guanine dinucleotide biosynthesis protein A
MSKILFPLTLFFCILLTSCGSDYSTFEDSAQEYSESDSKITSLEINNLIAEIKLFETDRKFKKFFTDGSFDKTKLITFLEKKGYTVVKNEDTADSSKKYFVNIYIENSGSMNGYVNGNTQFKGAIRDLLVMLKYYYGEKNINIHFINSDIYPTQIHGDIVTFSKTLNTKTFKIGDTDNSNLNNIFNQILNKTAKDTMSILLSDCIYSIKGSKTEDLLSDQKSLTKDAFLTKFKSKERLATSIVKLTSEFNGTYYDKDNKKTQLSGQLRPYYITIMATDKAMTNFNENIKLVKGKVEGFENKYNLTLNNYSQGIYFSVINTSDDSARFKPDRDFNKNGAIKGIKDVSINERNSSNFIFTVAVDMSTIPVEDSYILDKSNYNIKDANYKIKGIYPFSDKNIKPTTAIMLAKANAKPTHYIVFESTTPNFTNLTFTLKKQIPKWVYETNTNDDSSVSQNSNKTFGIKYLIEGISEAYETESKNNDYLNLTINIKK